MKIQFMRNIPSDTIGKYIPARKNMFTAWDAPMYAGFSMIPFYDSDPSDIINKDRHPITDEILDAE